MCSHGPAGSSPALDFLATIQARERLPGGAFAILDEADRATLEQLLGSYHEQGLTAALERRARTFLIAYRELDRHAGVLDRAERERLSQLLDASPAVLRVDRAGVVWSLPLARATAVRQSLGR